MGFNPRKMEANRRAHSDVEAAARRVTDVQVLVGPEHSSPLSILSGIILAARGRPESGAAGIVGGAILFSIGFVGFRTLARTPFA
jgi:hypothetical protein